MILSWFDYIYGAFFSGKREKNMHHSVVWIADAYALSGRHKGLSLIDIGIKMLRKLIESISKSVWKRRAVFFVVHTCSRYVAKKRSEYQWKKIMISFWAAILWNWIRTNVSFMCSNPKSKIHWYSSFIYFKKWFWLKMKWKGRKRERFNANRMHVFQFAKTI